MIRIWLGWALVALGYKLRPYDMLADRRRWFWQSRQSCERYPICVVGDGNRISVTGTTPRSAIDGWGQQ